jgi:hypothetical protein
VVLGLLLLAGDVGAKVWSEQRLQHEVRTRTANVGAIDVHISSFPFVGRLLVSQEVSSITAHASAVAAGPLTLTSVDVALHGVDIDRSRLLDKRQVVLTAIHSGTVTADITASALSSALGVGVALTKGALSVTALGKRVPIQVSVRNNLLSFKVAGISIPTLTIPRTDLVPCIANVQVTAAHVRLSCTIHEVPKALLHLVS